jgi:hypothetical protein
MISMAAVAGSIRIDVSVNGPTAAISVAAATGTVSHGATLNGSAVTVTVSAVSGQVIVGTPTTIDAPALGGAARAELFGGSAAIQPGFDGTASYETATYGGWNDQNMATAQNLVALQNNDSSFTLNLTQSGEPLNLNGLTIQLYVKATETTPDSSATTYTVGSGVTVITSQAGIISWVLPHTAATTAGQKWWRVDVTDVNENVGTCIYGNLYIVAV